MEPQVTPSAVGEQDNLPIECPFCHYHFFEKVGRLLTGRDIACPACKKVLSYEVDDVLHAIELSRGKLNGFIEPFKRLLWRK